MELIIDQNGDNLSYVEPHNLDTILSLNKKKKLLKWCLYELFKKVNVTSHGQLKKSTMKWIENGTCENCKKLWTGF